MIAYGQARRSGTCLAVQLNERLRRLLQCAAKNPHVFRMPQDGCPSDLGRLALQVSATHTATQALLGSAGEPCYISPDRGGATTGSRGWAGPQSRQAPSGLAPKLPIRAENQASEDRFWSPSAMIRSCVCIWHGMREVLPLLVDCRWDRRDRSWFA